MSARRLLLLIALCSVFLSGCRGLCRRDAPRPYAPLPPGPNNLPPQNIPDGAPPLPPVPRGSGGGAELLLPQPIPGKSRSEYSRVYPEEPVQPKAQPIEPRAKVTEAPETLAPRRQPPVAVEEPAKVEPRQPDAAKGIEEFTLIKEGITAGLRPTLEGLDWLQERRYKTVIYLRRTDDDDTTDRRQIEKRGLTYIPIVVKVDEMNQAFIDDFSKQLTASEQQPLFVYARDGGVASAVWYMHLRRAEFLTHEEAKVRITRLGFKDEANDYFKAALKFFEAP